MKKKWAQVLLGTALALATGMSVASKLPDTIRLVVGYPAGGTADAVARVYAEQLREKLGFCAGGGDCEVRAYLRGGENHACQYLAGVRGAGAQGTGKVRPLWHSRSRQCPSVHGLQHRQEERYPDVPRALQRGRTLDQRPAG
uniref:Tripartite tricarboxylate transporter family receptor n=1 Tax=Parastrongyloides trichosuri TaxID=131310 RepID=A0A0N4ZVR7_PARTI